MLSSATDVALSMVSLASALCFWRLVRGPTLPDRILALDTLYVNAIAFIILFGIRTASTALFEAALLIAMVGFVSTIALAKYLLRGDIIE